MNGDKAASLIYLALLLAAVGGWIVVEHRQRLGQALRVALAWGMIFIGLMAGYGLWNDISNAAAPRQTLGQTGELIIPRASDGHYYLRLLVNGQEITFMADTGATNIVLSPADAQVLGMQPDDLRFLGEAVTANGTVRTARVALDAVSLGPFQDRDVTAYVNEAEMDGSLLGMDYLGRFSIEIAGERMILRR
jgi:aspartyl protease family protein